MVGYSANNNKKTELYLIAKNGYDVQQVNEKDLYDKMLLLQVTEKDKVKVINLLFEKNIDIYITDQIKRSVLLQAVEDDNKEIVELLLEKGVQLENEDKFKKSTIYRAVQKRYYKVIKPLLDKLYNMINKKCKIDTAISLVIEAG